MQHRYCEIIKQLNLWRNLHGLCSGAQLSGLLWGCDVTTTVSGLSHTLQRVAENAGVAAAKKNLTQAAQACVSWPIREDWLLGRRGIKTDVEYRCCSNGATLNAGLASPLFTVLLCVTWILFFRQWFLTKYKNITFCHPPHISDFHTVPKVETHIWMI